ncbi:cytochrome C oxidase subunit IV family protein [Mycolicibacterium holsaticum]|uniref:cytochrome C oxidase subunit IV family protein n=1 Tax=Mycolicibacterium holsaticum TaxID=152142 RepID=UPI001E2E6C68|nr:cytochrome C oxidase subunit IV family protein [Mycolicibacterium holsaticum]
MDRDLPVAVPGEVSVSSIVRSNATLIWLLLSALTVVSWLLGSDFGFSGLGHVTVSLIVIVVALFKVRMIGMYFMELRDAPLELRGLFEGYCLTLFVLMVGMFLFG